VTFELVDVSYNYKYSVLIITVIVSITQRILIFFNNPSVDSLPAVGTGEKYVWGVTCNIKY